MRKVLNLAENLKELRLSKNLSQAAMAKKLNFTKQTWSNYESGKYEPDLNTLIEISKIFECSIDFLLLNNNRTEWNLNSNKPIDAVDAIKELEKLIPKISLENNLYEKEIESLNSEIEKNKKEIENLKLCIRRNNLEKEHIEKVLRESNLSDQEISFPKRILTFKSELKTRGISKIDYSEEYKVTLKPPLDENKKYFLFKSTTDAMNKVVLKNQIFIVEETEDVKNGDFVLVTINNSFTALKQYFYIKDQDYVILSPFSTAPIYRPQIFNLSDNRIEIKGLFVDILDKYLLK